MPVAFCMYDQTKQIATGCSGPYCILNQWHQFAGFNSSHNNFWRLEIFEVTPYQKM